MKSSISFILSAALVAISMTSCKSSLFEENEAVTGEATEISCFRAKLSGKAILPKTVSTDLTIGILYAKTSGLLLNFATEVDAETLDSDYSFTVETEDLEPGTTYYFCSFVNDADDEITYGEVKTFTTLSIGDVILTLDATAVDQKSAVLNASLGISLEDIEYRVDGYGFEIGVKGGETIAIEADNLSSGKFSAEVGYLEPFTTYSFTAYVEIDGELYYGETKTFETVYVAPELIDMGLSVKWAASNIGASAPEENGFYFQWAGTQDVSDIENYLSWDNCPYHTGSFFYPGWTKYVPSAKSAYWSGIGNPDDKTTLDPKDDVANKAFGGSWHIPTSEEWAELLTNCVWAWKVMNGEKGYLVTSKFTGNSIFLPAAGCRTSDGLYYEGIAGYYWTSSLDDSLPYYAKQIYFFSFTVQEGYIDRYKGQSVRPVAN